MLVYRIEDADGEGMYTCNRSSENPIPSTSSSVHPLPRDDSGLVYAINRKRDYEDISTDVCCFIKDGNYIFGFGSTDQLRGWIYRDEWLWRLQRRGFRLAVFDIEDDNVLVGYTQSIFKRSDAKQVSYFEPAVFFGIHNPYDDDDEE